MDNESYSADELFKESEVYHSFSHHSRFSGTNMNEVVSNCHKQPDKLFTYNRLTIEEIVEEWNSLIVRLKAFNPSLRFLFTVRPIRHWKDGAHENQLSKSILLLPVEKILQNHTLCDYFLVYEILMDDLRDYR